MSFDQQLEIWMSSISKDTWFIIAIVFMVLFAVTFYLAMTSNWLKNTDNRFLKFWYDAGQRRSNRLISYDYGSTTIGSDISHSSSGIAGGGGTFGGGGASGSW